MLVKLWAFICLLWSASIASSAGEETAQSEKANEEILGQKATDEIDIDEDETIVQDALRGKEINEKMTENKRSDEDALEKNGAREESRDDESEGKDDAPTKEELNEDVSRADKDVAEEDQYNEEVPLEKATDEGNAEAELEENEIDDEKSVEEMEEELEDMEQSLHDYLEFEENSAAKEEVLNEEETEPQGSGLEDSDVDYQRASFVAGTSAQEVLNFGMTKSESESDQEDNEELVLRKQWSDEQLEEGRALCAEALELFNAKVQSRKAFELFKKAAELGNATARAKVALSLLFGDHMRRNSTAALGFLTDLANEGMPMGQLGLGFMYATGIGVNSSQAKSVVYYTFSALGGDSFGQMIMGYRYWSGITLVQGCEAALTYYRKVAHKVAQNLKAHGGPIIQRHRLVDDADLPPDETHFDEDLLQYYTFLADKGDLQAALALGQLYFQGIRGVPQSFERAHHFFKLIVKETQNPLAYAYLGKLYYEGSSGIEQSDEKAVQYFKKSASEGNYVGFYGLGMMYLDGRGVPQDVAKAVEYLQKSAEQGWPEAQVQLGVLYYSGLGVTRDYRKAMKQFSLGSQSGNLLAYYNLAQMHAEGAGTVRACHTAVELYKNVAERGPWSKMLTEAYDYYKSGQTDIALIMYLFLGELGYEVAQSNAAYILDRDGSDVIDKDEIYPRALLHWNRAASQGYSIARLKLGDYHFYGQGTKQDYQAAALHYRLASEQLHNAQAMFNLAYMHEHGLGMKQDFHLAKRYYDMALESSAEAKAPATLALVGLSVKHFLYHWTDYFELFQTVGLDGFLGKDWDLYVMACLGGLLGLVVLIRQAQQRQREELERRLRRQREEEERREQEAAATARAEEQQDDLQERPEQGDQL